MAHAKRQRRENELSYIPFGPFQVRLPFIHYKIESVEFIQGLILGVTALSAVPYLEHILGFPMNCMELCDPGDDAVSAAQSAGRSGSSRMDHPDVAVDNRLSGRLSDGKGADLGDDRAAAAGGAGLFVHGYHKAGG